MWDWVGLGVGKERAVQSIISVIPSYQDNKGHCPGSHAFRPALSKEATNASHIDNLKFSVSSLKKNKKAKETTAMPLMRNLAFFLFFFALYF